VILGGLREARSFWPEYLAHHTHPVNRALHYLADFIVIGSAIAALVLERTWIAVLGASLGLALVLVGHGLVERNAPLVFRHPLLATLCNARMVGKACVGAFAAASLDGRGSRGKVAPFHIGHARLTSSGVAERRWSVA
jgi:hypothetical protein